MPVVTSYFRQYLQGSYRHLLLPAGILLMILTTPLFAADTATEAKLKADIEQLQRQVASLQKTLAVNNRAPTTDRSAVPTSPTQASVENEIAQINAKLDKIVQVLQISGSNVTLTATGNLNLESNAAILLKSSGTLTVDGGGGAQLRSDGVTKIDGSVVKLNNGGKSIARIGSKTVNGTVIDGSTTVFVP